MTAYLLLGVIVLVLVLLFVPLTFRCQGRLATSIIGEIELAWAGGLLAARWLLNQPGKSRCVLCLGRRVKTWKESRNELPPTTSDLNSAPAPPTRTPPNSPDRNKGRLRSLRPFLSKSVIRESWLFLHQIWKSLKLRLALDGEYGTDDPAVTGAIAAGIAVLNGEHGNLHLQPNFTDNALNIQGELGGRMVPALLLWECGRFIFKPPIRKIWWPMLTQKIIKNRGGV